jgi:biopolymer transport protein ExbD
MNFRKQSTIDPVPMQLAPLVDVLLLLVIFFAVSYKFGQDEQLMDISVPAADEGKERGRTSVGEIVVNVKKDGSLVVNGQDISVDELLTRLKNITAVFKDQAVIIRGDEVTDFKAVVTVMDTCQKAGIWNVAFATKPPETEPPKQP